VSGVPLAWLVTITTTATGAKIFSDDPKIGFLAAANDLSAKLGVGVLSPERAAVASKLIFNQQLDAALTAFFLVVVWVIVFEMLRGAWRARQGGAYAINTEAPYVPSREFI
jgi:carbon starvation protein